MPKISIKEYDLTKAGTTTTNNFSVVVPGFVVRSGKIDDESVFDENGIYECSSQSDFASAVGLIPVTTDKDIAGTAPTFTAVGKDDSGNILYKKTLTEQQYYQTYYNIIYVASADKAETQEVGYLQGYKPEDTKKAGDIYSFIAVKEADFSETTEYYVIASGNEGTNKIENVYEHMGNQIAYYLLGLGYTVLYKQLSTIANLKDPNFWDPLKDRVLYNFRYLIAGLKSDVIYNKETILSMYEVNTQMNAVAERNNLIDDPYSTGRGDCFALCEIPKNAYIDNNTPYTGTTLITAIQGAKTLNSTYAPYFVPAVTYSGEDSTFDNNEFPAAFHYLACAALAFQNYREWYAVAGYTRGISPYTVKSLAARIGDRAINELQPRNSTKGAVNVVTGIKGDYYIWGNRTGAPSKNKELVAQNFLNIRQLCCTIKKEIFDTCRKLTFDPNSDVLWTNFCLALTPTLEVMRADQGIKAYKIVKAKTDLKATLKAIVRIVPIEAVEDFDISLTLEDSVSGVLASFGEE